MDLTKYKQPQKQKTKLPHPLFACVELIEEAGLFTKAYGRGFWLRRLSTYAKYKSKAPEALYTELIGVLKQIGTMDPKYPKGATLTNKLKV